MLELRQRSKSSGSMTYGGYQAVDTDDDSDTTPLLDIHRLVEAPVERSTVCVKICFTFCLVAVLYLSSIAVMLGAHSQYRYIKIGSADKDKKLKMVEGVTQAICMYLVCLVISGYVWYTASNQKKYRDDDIRLLD